MNKLWKIGLVAGLLVTILALTSGCTGLFGTTTAPAASGNATGTAAGQSTWFSQYGMIIILVLIFAMFYFVMIRPQRKRQKERDAMMQGLQKGDRVITAGGIYGTVESLSEDTIVIKVEGGTTLRVARNSVAIRRDEIKK
jgi:preprotein translocase subunit YajC